jgi:hypothetical protein
VLWKKVGTRSQSMCSESLASKWLPMDYSPVDIRTRFLVQDHVTWDRVAGLARRPASLGMTRRKAGVGQSDRGAQVPSVAQTTRSFRMTSQNQTPAARYTWAAWTGEGARPHTSQNPHPSSEERG